ncbi:MAG: hypothetical protein JWQ04_1948 [Pedosphaera sp.]|nr:hypothetical protein [Pedosphaera sp.]
MSPSIAPVNDMAAAPARAVKISFLIPMHNGVELTRACLRSLEETVDLAPHEVILINDASTDGTAEFLAKLAAPFRIIHNKERLSYAASINRGVAEARGEILCLLNNDLLFSQDWLPPMLRAFDRFEKVGIVGNVQIDPRNGSYNHMGIVFTKDAVPIHFGEWFPFRPFRGLTEWKAVTSACWLVRKSVFLEGGGYNEAYRNAGYEDVELCLTLGSKGYRHYVANESVIQHFVNSSPGRLQFESENAQYFRQRWREHILAQLTPRECRRCAANYVLRCLGQRSHCNRRQLRKALFTLLKCGH